MRVSLTLLSYGLTICGWLIYGIGIGLLLAGLHLAASIVGIVATTLFIIAIRDARRKG